MWPKEVGPPTVRCPLGPDPDQHQTAVRPAVAHLTAARGDRPIGVARPIRVASSGARRSYPAAGPIVAPASDLPTVPTADRPVHPHTTGHSTAAAPHGPSNRLDVQQACARPTARVRVGIVAARHLSAEARRRIVGARRPDAGVRRRIGQAHLRTAAIPRVIVAALVPTGQAFAEEKLPWLHLG